MNVSAQEIIQVNNLRKTFKIRRRENGFTGAVRNLIHPKTECRKAVDDISFQIREGEMVGFIGPNGAGKSTTVKMLSGILYPDEGDIRVAGYNPCKQRKEYVGHIGVVFGQKSQLLWELSPLETFDLLKHIYKIPENIYRENVERYTSLLDLESFLHQPVRQLSLGQRMRADIAASLLHSPGIVFFDEPTIGIDVVGKEKIRSFLRELNHTDNITMIFTTHDMQDIEKTCERLIIIDQGKKLYDGELSQIRQKYASNRVMEVDFEEVPQNLFWENVTVSDVKNHPTKKLLSFLSDQIPVAELMSNLMEHYRIRDISVKEPEIDSIICDIYEGAIQI